jgi:Putative zinc-finger
MQLHRDHRPQPGADLPPRAAEGHPHARRRGLFRRRGAPLFHVSRRQTSACWFTANARAYAPPSKRTPRLVTDYVEGSLATEESALFERHLNFCDGCEWYADQMRSTVAAVGRIEETDVPPAMRERLLVALRDRTRS